MIEYALITGGSSGIGYALANVFAQHGYGLALASSNAQRLEQAAAVLSRAASVPIRTFPVDLSSEGAAKKLYSAVKEADLNPLVLVNNAGFGLVGPAEQIPLERDAALLRLNILSLTALCKLFLPDLYRRGEGYILNVASTGAFQPGPYTASYFASKSYVLSYSRAIGYEAKSHGVRVCALCPGSTRTEFFRKEGMPVPSLAMTADAVARNAYRSLMRGRSTAVPGLLNQLIRAVPSEVKLRFVARMKQK